MIATEICLCVEPYASFNTKVHPFYAKKKSFLLKIVTCNFCFSGDKLLLPGVYIKSSNSSSDWAEHFFVSVSIGCSQGMCYLALIKIGCTCPEHSKSK